MPVTYFNFLFKNNFKYIFFLNRKNIIFTISTLWIGFGTFFPSDDVISAKTQLLLKGVAQITLEIVTTPLGKRILKLGGWQTNDLNPCRCGQNVHHRNYILFSVVLICGKLPIRATKLLNVTKLKLS